MPITPPPPLTPQAFVGHLSFDLKIVSNAHSGASLHVQMPHAMVGLFGRVQMTNLWNKKTIFPHKLMYFL